MTLRKGNFLRQLVSLHRNVLLSMAALLSLTASFVFLFYAGCTGDTKTWAVGDVVSALHYETVGVALLGLSLVICIMLSQGDKAWQGLVFFIFGGLALWLMGIQVEVWGSQHCF